MPDPIPAEIANIRPGAYVVQVDHTFGTNGSIKDLATLKANFLSHDNFFQISNGSGQYGSLTVAFDESTKIADISNLNPAGTGFQPVDPTGSTFRSFTANSMLAHVRALPGFTTIGPMTPSATYHGGCGSIMMKYTLPSGGSHLGKTIIWETRMRFVEKSPVVTNGRKFPDGYWSAIWAVGDQWDGGCEMDVMETYSYVVPPNDVGSGLYNGDAFHVNSVGGEDERFDFSDSWWSPNSMPASGMPGIDQDGPQSLRNWHTFTWAYYPDDTYEVWIDGYKFQLGTLPWVVPQGAHMGESPNMNFLFDFAALHRDIYPINETVIPAADLPMDYEISYTRIFLAEPPPAPDEPYGVATIQTVLTAMQTLSPLLDAEFSRPEYHGGGLSKFSNASTPIWQTAAPFRQDIYDAIQALKLIPDAMSAAALLTTQLSVAQFAPFGILTAANWETAINGAIAFAANSDLAPKGATINMPAGNWPMLNTLTIPGRHLNRSIRIVGQGKGVTVMQWPQNFVGDGVVFTGDGTGSGLFQFGGGADFSVECIGANLGGGVGAGIRLSSCIDTQLERVSARGWTATNSHGFQFSLVGADGTDQNCSMTDCHAIENWAGWRLKGAHTCVFRNCLSNQCTGGAYDIGLEGLQTFIWYAGMAQSSTTYAVRTLASDVGGNHVTFEGIYCESGTQTRLFFADDSSVSTFNQFKFVGCSVQNIAIAAELKNVAVFDLVNPVGSPTSGVYVKASGCKSINGIGLPDPADSPAAYQLDDYSQANTTVTSAGKVYSGNYGRGMSLTRLLLPYSIEIFDPNNASYVSVISGAVDILFGRIASSLSAPTAGQRPTYTASSANFRGRSTFTCDTANNRVLAGILTPGVAIGAYPGLLAVWRLTTLTASTNNVQGVRLGDASAGQALVVGANDVNSASTFYGLSTMFVSGVQYAIGGTASTGVVISHAQRNLSLADPNDTRVSCRIAQSARSGTTFFASANMGVTATQAMDRLRIGGFDPGGDRGGNIEVAYVAVLGKALPPGVQQQALDLINRDFLS